MNHGYLDPLPADLTALERKSQSCAAAQLDVVEHIIARLEHARTLLAHANPGTTSLPSTSRLDDQSYQQQQQVPVPPTAATTPAEALLTLSSYVKTANANVASASKEWAIALSALAKTADKRFQGPPLPLFPSNGPTSDENKSSLDPSLDNSATSDQEVTAPSSTTFSSPRAVSSLNKAIAQHLARLGAFESLDVFVRESSTSALEPELLDAFKNLHAILSQLERGECTNALAWVAEHPGEDVSRDLEFELRKEEYVRLLLGGSDLGKSSMEHEPLLPARDKVVDPHVSRALTYGGVHFRLLLSPERRELVSALLTAPVFMPFSRLLTSPYASLFAEYAEPEEEQAQGESSGALDLKPGRRLCTMFAAAFLKSINMPRDSPLSVVTDIGGGGAMAKIQKVRAVMKEKKTEWSAVGELPVEIPLPPDRKYHSIFACPVSKEQSTFANPPMLLRCGHVIARESLARLARGTPTLKCPYCPDVSHVAAAIRVHF
ncbi:hypothetical protein OIO90_003722 [Microbotryomycetes sp. JL221]|nr:hypothetical protein OIO90_003722 [Microbotryomycetes sp. JL221]